MSVEVNHTYIPTFQHRRKEWIVFPVSTVRILFSVQLCSLCIVNKLVSKYTVSCEVFVSGSLLTDKYTNPNYFFPIGTSLHRHVFLYRYHYPIPPRLVRSGQTSLRRTGDTSEGRRDPYPVLGRPYFQKFRLDSSLFHWKEPKYRTKTPLLKIKHTGRNPFSLIQTILKEISSFSPPTVLPSSRTKTP